MKIFSEIIDNGSTVTVDKVELLNLLSSELTFFEQYFKDNYPEAIEVRRKLIQQLAISIPEYKED